MFTWRKNVGFKIYISEKILYLVNIAMHKYIALRKFVLFKYTNCYG